MLQQKMINFIYIYILCISGKTIKVAYMDYINDHFFFKYWNTFTIFKTRILRCCRHLWNFDMLFVGPQVFRHCFGKCIPELHFWVKGECSLCLNETLYFSNN